MMCVCDFSNFRRADSKPMLQPVVSGLLLGPASHTGARESTFCQKRYLFCFKRQPFLGIRKDENHMTPKRCPFIGLLLRKYLRSGQGFIGIAQTSKPYNDCRIWRLLGSRFRTSALFLKKDYLLKQKGNVLEQKHEIVKLDF